MISGISSNSTMQYQVKSSQTAQSLSDERTKELQEILSKYDSKETSGDTLKTMMDEIRKAGFGPKDGSKDVIEGAGFALPKPSKEDMEKMGPPPPMDGENSPMPEYLSDFIAKQGSGSVNQADINALIKNLEKDGKYTSGSIIDVKS